MTFRIFDLQPLNGSFYIAEKPDSIAQKWFTEDYQKKYEKYFNDNIGFRNSLVRLNNQIQYSFFNKTSVKKTLIGNNGYLYEHSYVDEHYGHNYIGYDNIKYKSAEIKEFKEFFEKKGIDVIPVFLPGKASYFPEYIPKKLKRDSSISNYSEFKKQFAKDGIDFIDLNEKFVKLKQTSKYPLFPKTGIHWTELGAVIGIDEIVKFIEHERNIDLQDFNYDEMEFPDNLRGTDNDIEKAMNLLFDIDFYKMAYPIIKYDTTKHYAKINILMIGDSYCFNILETGILQNICNKSELWYYNRTIHPNRSNNINVKDLDYIEELSKFDVILLLVSESNYYRIDLDIYKDYINKINSLKISEEEVSRVIERIKNNNEWYNKVKQQAIERNISEEEMLRKSAIYTIKNRKE